MAHTKGWVWHPSPSITCTHVHTHTGCTFVFNSKVCVLVAKNSHSHACSHTLSSHSPTAIITHPAVMGWWLWENSLTQNATFFVKRSAKAALVRSLFKSRCCFFIIYIIVFYIYWQLYWSLDFSVQTCMFQPVKCDWIWFSIVFYDRKLNVFELSHWAWGNWDLFVTIFWHNFKSSCWF